MTQQEEDKFTALIERGAMKNQQLKQELTLEKKESKKWKEIAKIMYEGMENWADIAGQISMKASEAMKEYEKAVNM